VFLKETGKYVIFGDTVSEKYYMTVTGRIDNNKGESIEVDDVDKVARGFFWKDLSYGFFSVDGFVIYWDKEQGRWFYKSLRFSQHEWNHEDKNFDLTKLPSNLEWSCEITLDPNPSPEWNEVYCTREIPVEANFDTLEVRYMPEVVVNAVGYHFEGIDSGKSRYELGGQVTL